MTRREYRTMLKRLAAGEKLFCLQRDEHGKLNTLFNTKDLQELHSLGYLEVPKNFLNENKYIEILKRKHVEYREAWGIK